MRLPSNLDQLRAAWRTTSEHKARTTPCFRVVNAATDRTKLYVYDVIGGWDLDASEFVQAVHAIQSPAIDMHVNSPGGFVFDAVAMFEAVKSHPATVHTHVDGLAASAASFLAMAGDTVDIAKGGRMMIHDALGVGIGNAAHMREYADLLDAISGDISGYYADRAGGTPKSWRTAMLAETWYSASEAVDAGLADQVTGTKDEPDNRTRLIKARHRAALNALEGVK
jgi:ATP-dependent protease ClpP protease subunit